MYQSAFDDNKAFNMVTVSSSTMDYTAFVVYRNNLRNRVEEIYQKAKNLSVQRSMFDLFEESLASVEFDITDNGWFLACDQQTIEEARDVLGEEVDAQEYEKLLWKCVKPTEELIQMLSDLNKLVKTSIKRRKRAKGRNPDDPRYKEYWTSENQAFCKLEELIDTVHAHAFVNLGACSTVDEALSLIAQESR